MSLNYTFTVTDDKVILSFNKKGSRRWTFLKEEFNPEDMEAIIKIAKGDHSATCGGCHTMPTNGYKSDKRSWCDLSRTVANIQSRGRQAFSAPPQVK